MGQLLGSLGVGVPFRGQVFGHGRRHLLLSLCLLDFDDVALAENA